MPQGLPPLSSLRAFEAVVRLGSVTAAARELGRTHGAVSKQLRTLQDHLGAALFVRAGAGLKATPHGEALARSVREGLDAVETGYRAISAQLGAPSLHIACSVTFATRWLAPHLADFSRRRPDVRVRLTMTTAGELRTQDADMLLAWDWRSYAPSDQTRAVPIAPVAFGPVCRPDYPLQRRPDGAVCAPVLIGHDFTSRSWDLWRERSGASLEGERGLSFPHTHLGIEAAVAGMGVALVERRLIAHELTDGRLIAPFGFTEFEDPLAAIVAETAPPHPTDDFITWLREALAPARPDGAPGLS